MGKISCKLESLVKKEFSTLSFYNGQHDGIEIAAEENDKNVYKVEYNAYKFQEADFKFSYLKCNLTIDLVEKAAVWIYVWLDDEQRGKGWGGELVKAGESLFKKLGMQTAYIDNNSNQPFWIKMGYDANLKVLVKRYKKNFYQHVYECVTSMNFYNSKDIVITPCGNRVFDVGYTSYGLVYDSSGVSFGLNVDIKKKKVTWNSMQASHKELKELIAKFDKVFFGMGLKVK